MVQGFTSDKKLLFAATDPHHSRPHMPMVFLMGRNFGRGDAGAGGFGALSPGPARAQEFDLVLGRFSAGSLS
jgi:hypothetical protein